MKELNDRVRFVGDSCLVCGFAKPKGVWVGTNPEWYVCVDCLRKVQRWSEVQTLYRAVAALEDLMDGTIGRHGLPWPETWDDNDREFRGLPVACGLAKALDPFRYEDKDQTETADAIEFLRERGYAVEPAKAADAMKADRAR